MLPGLFADTMTDSTKKYDLNVDRLMFYGFCGFFFFIPVATSPAVITGLITLSIWIFSGRFIRDREWLRKEWTLPVIVFMLLPWAGLLYTEDLQTGLGFAKKSYYWLYAFAMAAQCLHGRAKAFINSYLLGLSLTVCISLLQYMGFAPMPKGFATGFVGGHSPYIMYSLLLVFGMLILSFYFRASATKKRKMLLMLLMCAYFLSLSVVPGRSGYLAFAALSPLMLYNIMGKKRLIGVIAAALMVIALLLSSSMVQDRIQLAANEVREYYYHGNKASSVGARLYMWDRSVRIFLENPIVGIGTGGYKNAMTGYREDSPLPEVMATGDMDGNGLDEAIVGFDTYGTYVYYNDSTWTKLHNLSPELIATGDMDGNGLDEVVMGFAGYGTFVYYNNGTWVKLHSLSPELIATGDLDGNGRDEVIVGFGSSHGTYVYYNDSTWAKLHGLSPERIAIDDLDRNGLDEVIVDFGSAYGTYVYYNDSTWTKLHSLSPEAVATDDLDGSGKDEVIVDFGSTHDTFVLYNGVDWASLYLRSPTSAHPHNSFLYLASSFGIVGLSAFLWLMVVFLRKGWRTRHGIAGYSVLTFGLVLLIGGLTDTQFLSLASGEMFALLMGLETEKA